MSLVLAIGAFAAMEPLAALLHRLVMHRRGYRWHASHHAAATRGFELNDLFPLVFGMATIVLIGVGSWLPAFGALRPIGAGVTAYGIAYLVVHDLAVHGRGAGRPVGDNVYLRWVRAAHRRHHVGGAAPFGFLAPIATRGTSPPREPRGRRDPSGRPIAAAPATRSLRAAGTDSRRENTSYPARSISTRISE
jgi:beta-carotene 3-hydroxylase